MHRKRILLAACAALTAALGFTVSILTTARPAAAVDITALPDGYRLEVVGLVAVNPGDCQISYVVHWYDQQTTIGFGDAYRELGVPCNPDFQKQLDAFVAATYTPVPPVGLTVWGPPNLPPVTTVVVVPPPPVTTIVAAPDPAPVAPIDTTPAPAPEGGPTPDPGTTATPDPVAPAPAPTVAPDASWGTTAAPTLAAPAGEAKNETPFTNPV